jgi:hypothetical protein
VLTLIFIFIIKKGAEDIMKSKKATPKKKAAPKKKVARKTTPKTTPKKTTSKKVRKIGSGRTKGSYSFINVKLTDLNKAMPEASIIMISRKWAQNLATLGIKIKGTPIVASTNTHNSLKNPVGITIKNMKDGEVEESAQVSLKSEF